MSQAALRTVRDCVRRTAEGGPQESTLAGDVLAAVRQMAESPEFDDEAGEVLGAWLELRAERERQGPRRYRVVRALHTLAGKTVPWHDQPGGGQAYYLPRSVEAHVANGSLTEL